MHIFAPSGHNFFAPSGHNRTMLRTVKRTSYACSISCYRTNSATSLGNHKQEHEKQVQKEMEFVSNNNLHTNEDSLVNVTMSNVQPNTEDCEHCTPYVLYYEMTMDDLEEQVINDCYGLMEYDKNDAIDYEDEEEDDDNTVQWNIVETMIV